MSTITITDPAVRLREQLQDPVRLILWNDEHNTFDWVIESLIAVCGHTKAQAEQSAWFVHFRGKYAVKEGYYEDLNPMRESLLDRGLNATLDM